MFNQKYQNCAVWFSMVFSLFLLAVSSSAFSYTLSMTDISNFSFVDYDDPINSGGDFTTYDPSFFDKPAPSGGTSGTVGLFDDGYKFIVTWNKLNNPTSSLFQQASFISEDLDLNLASETFLALNITNLNETWWDFALGLRDGSGNIYMGSFVDLLPKSQGGSTFHYSIDLATAGATVELTDIENVFISFGHDFFTYDDGTAEFALSSVPEPSSFYLLGLGLLGTTQLLRKKRKLEGNVTV